MPPLNSGLLEVLTPGKMRTGLFFLSIFLTENFPLPALPLGVTPRQGFLALVSGLLGASAFWPLSLWPLMLFSIALFLRLLRDQDAQTARNIGLVYGLAYAAGTMHWMFLIFGARAIPLLALMTAYFGLLATLFALTRGLSMAARVCLVALFAVAVEWLRGDAWYLRFPWYTPSHALAVEPPMVAGARWLGTYGLSYVIWLIAAAGAFRPMAYAGFLLLPACSLLLPADGEPDRRVLLLQAELGSYGQVISKVPAGKADLSVLPELAYTCSPNAALSQRNGPAELARKTSGPVVFGAIEGTYGEKSFSNVAAIIGSDGEMLGTFPKQHPVPLMLDGTPGTVSRSSRSSRGSSGSPFATTSMRRRWPHRSSAPEPRCSSPQRWMPCTGGGCNTNTTLCSFGYGRSKTTDGCCEPLRQDARK